MWVTSLVGLEQSRDHWIRESENSRIMEWFGVEGTFQGHPVQLPAMNRDTFPQIRLLRAPSKLLCRFSGMEQPPPLWAICSTVSPPSFWGEGVRLQLLPSGRHPLQWNLAMLELVACHASFFCWLADFWVRFFFFLAVVSFLIQMRSILYL